MLIDHTQSLLSLHGAITDEAASEGTMRISDELQKRLLKMFEEDVYEDAAALREAGYPEFPLQRYIRECRREAETLKKRVVDGRREGWQDSLEQATFLLVFISQHTQRLIEATEEKHSTDFKKMLTTVLTLL